jgi:DNA uptake protein ComE-like DNA-binding protein
MACLRTTSRKFAVLSLLLAGLFMLPALAGAQADTQAATTAAKAAVKGPLNLNAATKEELMAIPGIDDALAQKIIDGRPYQSKTELTKRNIIPLDLYNKIKGKLTTKPVEH